MLILYKKNCLQDLAWTGWKSSGRGVTLSRYGFEQFTRLRSVHIKAHPFE